MEFDFDSSVRVLSSEVKDGSMSLNDGSFEKNLPIFLKNNNIELDCAYCLQCHGDKVRLVDAAQNAGECDGIISSKNIALAVRTADCIPVAVIDNSQIGIIHCGRKSIISGIIQNLKNQLDSPSLAKIFIGPHIRVNNYEVKQDVVDEILGTKWEKFLIKKSDKYYFDLTRALIFALDEIGIKRDNIKDSKIDTFSDPRFFSYRLDPNNVKTFVTVIYKNGSK